MGEGKEIPSSRWALLQEILEITERDVNQIDKVRRFAKAFELAGVLEYLREVGSMQVSNNNEDEEKFLTYINCLDALRREDSQCIRSLLAAFNHGRTPKEKKPRHYQELAELMLDESNFNRVIRLAEKLQPSKPFTSFRVCLGVAQQETALVGKYMQTLPGESLKSPSSTVADLKQFFEGIQIPHYFVVVHAETRELIGMVSINDYSPNRDAIKDMAQDTLVTSLKYFKREREIETLRDADTMDVAQKKLESHPEYANLFVVDEARCPKGLLSKNDLEQWEADRLG